MIYQPELHKIVHNVLEEENSSFDETGGTLIMHVQEIVTPRHQERCIVVDGWGNMVVPVVGYLKYLDASSRARNHATHFRSGTHTAYYTASITILLAPDDYSATIVTLVDQAFSSFLSRNSYCEGVSPAWRSQNMSRTLRISLHLLTQVANMCFD